MNETQSLAPFRSGSQFLWTRGGMAKAGIAEQAQTLALAFPGALYWLEPAWQLNDDRLPGRLRDFEPFGETPLPDKLPALEAAYLFGHGTPAGLHIVALPEGCRWFEFSVRPQDGWTPVATQARDYPVLARQDIQRFFGAAEVSSRRKTLRVTEYWTEDGLFAWWLSEER